MPEVVINAVPRFSSSWLTSRDGGGLVVRWLLAVLLLVGIGCHSKGQDLNESPSETASDLAGLVRLEIDPSVTFQTVTGFGISGAWWAQDVGGWDDAPRDAILDLLFGTAESEYGVPIGLSIYRFNIGAGEGEEIADRSRRTQSFEVEAGVYDFTRDANSVNVLKGVRARGVEQFVFFANSPPPRLLISGQVSGGPNGRDNHRPGTEAAFARYLLDITEHWQRTLELPYVMVSPINEPQWYWGEDGRSQEGCHYEPAQVAEVLRATIEEERRRAQEQELERRIGIEGPEAAEWGGRTAEYLRVILEDDALRTGLGAIAVHSYWSDDRERRRIIRLLAEWPDVPPVAMTEYTEMEHGRCFTMDSALHLAEVMMSDLTFGNASSWSGWIACSRYNYHDGLIYVDLSNETFTTTKRLSAMGQFSRFVLPGSIRVTVDVDQPELKAAGFLTPARDALVVVMINAGSDALTVDPGLPADSRIGEVRVTDATRDLAVMVPESDRVLIPAESVVTIRVLLGDALTE